MGFDSVYIFGNRNDYLCKYACFVMYFISDVNMTSLCFQQDSEPAHRARDIILNCYDAPL